MVVEEMTGRRDKTMQKRRIQIREINTTEVQLTEAEAQKYYQLAKSNAESVAWRGKVMAHGLHFVVMALVLGSATGFITLLVRPDHHVTGFKYGVGLATLFAVGGCAANFIEFVQEQERNRNTLR